MTSTLMGMPIWTDLASPDVDASVRFYGDLFGWTPRKASEPEAGGYTMFLKDGKAVTAVGPMMGDGQSSAWLSYFADEDVDAATARVEGNRGKVVMAPMDVMGYGRMAVFLDPTGAVFALWQPGEMPGEEIAGVPGARSWNELTTRDPEAAKSFYADVLGWESRDVPFESTAYTIFQISGKPAAGMMPMEGDDWPSDLPPHWMVYFEVDNPDAVSARAADLGGTISVPPTDSDAGRFAVLGDPHGAFFSVIKSNPNYQP